MTYSVTAGGTRLFCEDWGDGRGLWRFRFEGRAGSRRGMPR